MLNIINPRFRVIVDEYRQIAGFSVEPDMKFFESFLRKREKTAVSPAVESMVKSTRETVENLIQPAAVYGIYTADEKLKSWFPNSNYVGLGIATIGHQLEEEIERHNNNGDLAKAFLIDAWGSAFVEGSVQVVDRLLRIESSMLGCSSEKRRSPGYKPWMLEEQAELFTYLPGNSIGVKLTETYSMLPRKSVSFGIKIIIS